MLRAFVVVLGAALLLGGGFLWLTHPAIWPSALELAIFGALILVGTFFEKRYRTPRSAPPPDWKATGERFRDPVSGKMVDVRFNPATGERAYINED